MKRLKSLVMVVCAFVGQTATAQTTLSENFEAGNAEGWTTVQGQWQIVSPGFESNYSLRGSSDTLGIIAAPSDGWFGVYEFDYKIPESWQDLIIYLQKTPIMAALEPTARFYAIGLHPKGGDSRDYIKGVVHGEPFDLFTYSTSDSNLTVTNTWNHARIERLSNGEIKVWVNGRLHMSVVDDVISSRGALFFGCWENCFLDNVSYVGVGGEPDNVLLNPSFESIDSSYGVARYWEFYPGHQAIASFSTDSRHGKYSQRIDIIAISPPAMHQYTVVTQSQETLQLQGRKIYEFSFWAKGKGRIAPSIILNAYDYVKWGKIVSLTPSWQFFQIRFTTPDTVVSVNELIRYEDNSNFSGTIEAGDWALIDEAILEGPLVEIKGVIADPATTDPGNAVAISAFVEDASRKITSVQAEIESPDETLRETIQLFDDGAHNDDAANDGTYSQTWTTPVAPANYIADILVSDIYRTDAFNNATVFSTISSSLPRQVTADPMSDFRPALLQTLDGKIWLFWNSSRNGLAIWYKVSDDHGQTWSTERQLFTERLGIFPSAAQTADGRMWVFYYDLIARNIWYVTSDDHGGSWSSTQQFIADGLDENFPNVAVDRSGKMIVAWQSNRFGNLDILYRLSLDNGRSWSNVTALTSDPYPEYEPAVAIDSSGVIHIIWVWSNANELFYSKSDTDGQTWTSPECLTLELQGGARYPRIDFDPSGKLWVVFNFADFYDKNRIEYDWDIYSTSRAEGLNWSPFVKLTRFVGLDGSPDVLATDQDPLVAWYSDRTGDQDIWGGTLGLIHDSNPPPYISRVEHRPYSPAPTNSDVIAITASVRDESSVETVRLVYSLNDVLQPGLAMHDDGNHYDGNAGNNVYGANIGPYPPGTLVKYQVEASDAAGNTVMVPQVPRSARVIGPFVQSSLLLLVADYEYDYSSLTHYYSDALDTYAHSYDVWDSFLRDSPPDSILLRYVEGAIIWAAPYAGHIRKPEVQSRVKRYLDAGGRLFVSGQNLGSSMQGTDLYTNYFHARFVQENAGSVVLEGVPGEPITEGLVLLIAQGDGANNQFSPDVIEPLFPAVSIFNFGFSAGVSMPLASAVSGAEFSSDSIAYNLYDLDQTGTPSFVNEFPAEYSLGSTLLSGSGAIRVDNGTSRVVYCSFGFEAINNKADRALLMNRIVNWLSPSTNRWINIRGPHKVFPGDTIYYHLDFGGGSPNTQGNVPSRSSAAFDADSIFINMVLPDQFNYVRDDLGFPVTIWPLGTAIRKREYGSLHAPGIQGGTLVSWLVGTQLPALGGGEVQVVVDQARPTNTSTSTLVNLVVGPIPAPVPIGGSEVPHEIPKIYYDIAVQKFSRPQQVRAGALLTYVIQAYNLGAQSAGLSTAILRDFLPSQTKRVVSTRPGATQEGSHVLKWTFEQLSKQAGTYLAEVAIETFGDTPAGAILKQQAEADLSQTAIEDTNRANNSYTTRTTVLNSYDPNDIAVDPKGFVRPGEELTYFVHYENEGNADAIDIRIENAIDANLNAERLVILGEKSSYNARTRQIIWDFRNINLPPDSTDYVIYRIPAHADLPSGTIIRNKATIYFDFNPGIETPEVTNVVDGIKPSSRIDSLLQIDATRYKVFWSGFDEHSGIRDYTVYLAENADSFTPWLLDTTITSAELSIQAGKTYRIFTIARDNIGNVEDRPDSFDVRLPLPTGVRAGDGSMFPTEFSLSQNYPNPFNPQTIIEYQLPKASTVELSIYNTLGQRVRTLVSEKKAPGYYRITWDGRNDVGSRVSSGLYIFQFKANSYRAVKKAIVLR